MVVLSSQGEACTAPTEGGEAGHGAEVRRQRLGVEQRAQERARDARLYGGVRRAELAAYERHHLGSGLAQGPVVLLRIGPPWADVIRPLPLSSSVTRIWHFKLLSWLLLRVKYASDDVDGIEAAMAYLWLGRQPLGHHARHHGRHELMQVQLDVHRGVGGQVDS